MLLLSVSSAFHWSEGRCWPLYRNRRRAHYTEANFAIPAISAPVPQQIAQALVAAVLRALLFAHGVPVPVLPASAYPRPVPAHPQTTPPHSRRTPVRRRTTRKRPGQDRDCDCDCDRLLPLCRETPRSGPSTQTVDCTWTAFSPPSHATLSSAPSICCTIHSTHHRL